MGRALARPGLIGDVRPSRLGSLGLFNRVLQPCNFPSPPTSKQGRDELQRIAIARAPNCLTRSQPKPQLLASAFGRIASQPSSRAVSALFP